MIARPSAPIVNVLNDNPNLGPKRSYEGQAGRAMAKQQTLYQFPLWDTLDVEERSIRPVAYWRARIHLSDWKVFTRSANFCDSMEETQNNQKRLGKKASYPRLGRRLNCDVFFSLSKAGIA
jgi:hypothetical protein